ncbi:hypothetical protein NC651_014210 [Populus alba x Populus x berolinensis]|nr:hypothetical protein NC651_014210 [Populus alba x Populus x berolinensis]
MNEHKRWETILVHPADSKPYNKSLVKALFIIKVYDASIYIRGNHDLLPALQFFKHSCLSFAPLVAMLGPPLGPSIDMMSMASTFSSAGTIAP